MKCVATHRSPDADAIVAAWLAEKYLFAGEAVEIVFITRRRLDGSKGGGHLADCVVDVTNTYDPQRLIFDHKPPAFPDRNASCATRLLWEHLISLGKPVQHLAALVTVVHEGDANPPGKVSERLRESRQKGLHFYVSQSRSRSTKDTELYADVKTWLCRYDEQIKKENQESDASEQTRAADSPKRPL